VDTVLFVFFTLRKMVVLTKFFSESKMSSQWKKILELFFFRVWKIILFLNHVFPTLLNYGQYLYFLIYNILLFIPISLI